MIPAQRAGRLRRRDIAERASVTSSPSAPAPDIDARAGLDPPVSSTRWSRRVSAFDARPWLLAVLMGLLTSVVAFAGSWRVSMWIDEGYTLSVATRSVHDVWRMVHNIDIVHALYNVMLHPWLQILGVSAASARLPSTLAVGVAAAGVVVLTRRLAGTPAAIAAGLVFAVLPRVTSIGMESRSYATTAAIAVWITVLFVSLLSRPTLAKHIGYALFGAFAVSLNIFLVLLLGAHGVALLMSQRFHVRRSFWTWLVAAGAALAGGVPVLLVAMSQAGQIGPTRLTLVGYARSALVNQWFLGETPTIFVSGGTITGSADAHDWWKAASVLLAGVCWLIGLYAVVRRDRADADDGRAGSLPASRRPGFRPVLLAWIILPTAALVGYALVGSPIYNPRYLSFGAPAVAALVGIGLVKLRWGWPRWVAAALILVLAIPIYVSQRTPNAKGGADWMQVSQFVADHRGPHDAVYFAPRTPPVGGVIGLTSRTAATLYPAAFAGMVDLTLVATPARSGDLLGVSRPLTASVDRLDAMTSVFVVRRRDYPPAEVAADTAVLTDAGFRPGPSWKGLIDNVAMFTR
jgi:mannosyltransferase